MQEMVYDLRDNVLWEAMMPVDTEASSVKIPAAGEEADDEVGIRRWSQSCMYIIERQTISFFISFDAWPINGGCLGC